MDNVCAKFRVTVTVFWDMTPLTSSMLTMFQTSLLLPPSG